MNASTPRFATRCTAALAVVSALALPMWSSAQDELSPQEQYRQDRAACSEITTQDRATCLYEARSVLRDMRQNQGKLPQTELSDTTLADNALMRCERVPEEARASCERLVRGDGEREGSVAEGGIVMWLAETDSAPGMSQGPLDNDAAE